MPITNSNDTSPEGKIHWGGHFTTSLATEKKFLFLFNIGHG